MGVTSSLLGDESAVDPVIGGDLVGYRVLGIQQNAPCGDEFVPFFDFIITANDKRLLQDDGIFYKIIEHSEDKELELIVYNTKAKKTRLVVCRPNRNWDGEGLLGLTIKFDSFQDADDAIFHILEVEPNSPAQKAGLKSFEDFILGTPRYIMTNLDELNDFLTDNIDRTCELYVYSQTTDVVRMVELVPSLSWGGSGCLGCGVGHGYLHRLPRKTMHSIGEGRKEDYLRLLGKRRQPKKSSTKSDGKRVITRLGEGELHGEKADGRRVVKLDWDLPNDATAMAILKAESVQVLEADKETPNAVDHETVDLR